MMLAIAALVNNCACPAIKEPAVSVHIYPCLCHLRQCSSALWLTACQKERLLETSTMKAEQDDGDE